MASMVSMNGKSIAENELKKILRGQGIWPPWHKRLWLFLTFRRCEYRKWMEGEWFSYRLTDKGRDAAAQLRSNDGLATQEQQSNELL